METQHFDFALKHWNFFFSIFVGRSSAVRGVHSASNTKKARVAVVHNHEVHQTFPSRSPCTPSPLHNNGAQHTSW